jgi:hypothetical protein
MTEPVEQTIHAPFPESDARYLQITMGPCRLTVSAGAGDSLVSGTYLDPSGGLPCKVETDGTGVRIRQLFDIARLPKMRQSPEMNLHLGAAKPYALIIEGGANEIRGDLGALPLNRLEVRHGAGEVRLDFSSPTLQEMSKLTISSGAADTDASNLANANAAEISIDGGAAAFHLDFGGTLKRDTPVKITTGMAGVDLTVPSSTSARVKPKTTLGGVDVDGGWESREGGYWNKAAVAGSTPVITIDANISLSGLKLISS